MKKSFTERVKAGARRLRIDRKSHDDETTVGGNSEIYSGDPARDARRGNPLFPIPHFRGKHSHFTERSAETVVDGGDDLRFRMLTGSQEADVDFSGAGGEFGSADLSPGRPKYLHVEEYQEPSKHTYMCKRRLREESRRAYDDQNWYIPVDALESVLSAETVSSVLLECVPESSPEKIQDYVSVICGVDSTKSQEKVEFRKVLAILILSNKCHEITSFIDNDLSDNLLPFLKLGEERSPYRLALEGESESVSCFDGWTDEEVEEFDGHQWEVLAPFFARGPPSDDRVQQYELHYKRPLPFTPVIKDDSSKSQQNGLLPSSTPFDRAGGHGRVMRIKIHSAHHKLPGEGDESFALKHLFRGSRTEFEREVEILARLSTWKNPHFVKLLITIEISSPHAKDLYLMFPWADSDLMQLWQGHQATRFATGAQNTIHQSARWVARQCYGLAQALNQLHNLEPKNQEELEASIYGVSAAAGGEEILTDETPLYGVHGDIKPQNILWYRRWDLYDDPLGLLQLADFGTGDIHRYISKSDFPRQEVQGTYRPPEFDLFQPLSRSIDIWSLGCVFLEFLTWLVRGWEDREFANKRMSQSMKAGLFEDTFFEIKSDGPKTIVQIHHGVVQWIKELRQHPRCTRYVHDFLDLISTQMLVVEPTESRLLIDSDNKPEIIGPRRTRIKSEELRNTLGKMFDRGESDPGYLSKPPVTTRQVSSLVTQALRFSASKSNLIQRRNTLERRTSSKSAAQSKRPTPSSTFDTRLEEH